MATPVIASNTKIDTEQHFMVKAGPGAGKTYWLIQHIKHVLASSSRLGKIKQIACITYTNIGVETILKRLPNCAERVDVCTIHSFLYENVIKPYFNFIAQEYDFAIEQLKVIDDTILTGNGVIYKIKMNIPKGYIYEDEALKNALTISRWQIDQQGLKFKPPYPQKSSKYIIPQAFYDAYKQYAWGHGIMHYDDVIFFSYQLILKYPFIANVISAKYPYVFIDEFQDSNPIQVEILKIIASTHLSVIGVIGDRAQAIYGFAGTDSNMFDKFTLEGIRTYEIQGNRRSSEEIIALLNAIRPDLQQYAVNSRHIESPILYVGDAIDCYNKFRKHCCSDIVTLSYAKITSNALRKQLGQIPKDENLFNFIPDDNWKRVKDLKNCITAIENALAGVIKDALKDLRKIESDERKQLSLISRLLTDYDAYKNQSAENFISYLKRDLGLNISGLSRGKAKDFYSSKTYMDLALYVSSPDISNIQDKTIHKAKGDEFDNVMVVLREENDLKFLTQSNLYATSDEHRVYYVAISRAKDRLAICVPSLSKEVEMKLSSLPISIVRG
jgi:DNA helicase II / ATP-dependent DNA helicase PcrA